MRRSLGLAMVLAIGLAMVACDDADVREVSDVLYQEDSDGTQHVLGVSTPATEGAPWPVAVMMPPLGVRVAPRASEVAGEGVVVFEVEPWPNDLPGPGAETALAEATSQVEQVACAVRFARAEADRYGGDPSNVSLYGWSAGP